MKNVVFIPNIAVGDGRSTPYHYSVKSWKRWGELNGVLVIEWTEPIMDTSTFPIIMQREWVFDILEHNDIDYDQVLIVDADTIVHPDCPNFFEETNHNYAAVVNNGCYEWVTRSIKGWGEAMFPNEPFVKAYDYFNTGFVIVNKKHKPFFDEVKNLYLERGEEIKLYRDRIKASTGQTIVNFMLQKHNIETTKLSEGYNLQDLFRKNLLHIPGHSWFSDELRFLEAGWVYHFNAIPQNPRDVAYWMERTYKHLYE
jgi:lipopolysaccharide biosynthesis glycosyltransferase